MVSSNWDDSFGSQHLPSAIYALALQLFFKPRYVHTLYVLSSQSGLSGSSRLIDALHLSKTHIAKKPAEQPRAA